MRHANYHLVPSLRGCRPYGLTDEEIAIVQEATKPRTA